MRQVAQIVLMAQIGSFVPASSAKIGIVDRIFTRVGASDDLSTGQSTFMVEMNEVANIVLNATPRSLLILDEIDAFPFQNNDTLNCFFKKSLKGNYIMMSATARDKIINEVKKDLEDLDKEKVLKIAKKKSEEIKEKLDDLYELAKKKATPVVEGAVEDLRNSAIKVTKEVLTKLEKVEK